MRSILYGAAGRTDQLDVVGITARFAQLDLISRTFATVECGIRIRRIADNVATCFLFQCDFVTCDIALLFEDRQQQLIRRAFIVLFIPPVAFDYIQQVLGNTLAERVHPFVVKCLPAEGGS